MISGLSSDFAAGTAAHETGLATDSHECYTGCEPWLVGLDDSCLLFDAPAAEGRSMWTFRICAQTCMMS